MAFDGSNLTSRDDQILDALTHRIRVLSVHQVARTWFHHTAQPQASANRRLRQLHEKGLIERFTMLAHPELELRCPVLTWSPGALPPNYERLSYQLVSRWREAVVPTPLIIATKAAGNWLGGYGGRRPRRGEASHDVAMASVFLRWRATQPDGVARWTSEAGLRQLGYGLRVRLPDAMVTEGEHCRAIEVGGAYGASKLREFHDFCDGRGLPYELW